MQQIIYRDTPWRSCCGTRTRSRRGGSNRVDGIRSVARSLTVAGFWGNYYSARLVRPISDEAVLTAPGSRSSPAGCG